MPPPPARPAPRDRYGLHLLLFVLTLASTVWAGGMQAGRILLYTDGVDPVPWWWFLADGLRFGLAFILFLTVHEFGHYFAARHHGIRTSLPYYIPMPLLLFGTLGAVIRIREPIPSTRKLFDVGASGPIAGFVVALALLVYALATLPPPTYVLDLGGHEALKAFVERNGTFPAEPLGTDEPGLQTLVFGETLLYTLLASFFEHAPPMHEMYHYPLLFAAWLGLFFTALNLLPVGQLDGGHILYALVGPRWHRRIARTFTVLLLVSGTIGYADEVLPLLAQEATWAWALGWPALAGLLYLYLYRIFDGDHRWVAPLLLGLVLLASVVPAARAVFTPFGYLGWFIFAALIIFLVRVEHPPVMRPEPLTPGRRALAWLSIAIFVLCFSIRPIYML